MQTDREKVEAAIKRLHEQEAERKERHRERFRQWHKDNAEYHNERSKQWYRDNSIRAKETQKSYNNNLRLKCLQYYSHSITPYCMCPGCNVTTYEFLSIDHINGGGDKHRREIGHHNLYRWLINNNFPPGFQILCLNCNMAKNSYGKCPHESVSREFDLVKATSFMDGFDLEAVLPC